MRGRPRITDTVPKLDKVEYLFDTLRGINEGLSFDDLRLNLIELRQSLDRKTRKDLRPEQRPRVKALLKPKPDTFWANAREAVRELMRLGMVVRAAMPNTSAEFARLKDTKFKLTDEGQRFGALGELSVHEFRDRFYCAMDPAHPYLRGLRQRLQSGELFIPRINRADLPGDTNEWRKGPPEPLEGLAKKVSDAIVAAIGQHVSPGDLENALTRSLAGTWLRRVPEGDSKTVSRWVVKAVNERIVQSVAAVNGIPMDFIAFRHAVSLLSGLHICSETRALPGRQGGWSIWLTADGDPPDADQEGRLPATIALDEALWIKRRVPSDEVVLEAIVQAILSLGGFCLIHEVRACVSHELGIHDWTVDEVLRRVHGGSLGHHTYDLHFDAGGGERLPASEEPFVHGDKLYYLVTVLKRSNQ